MSKKTLIRNLTYGAAMLSALTLAVDASADTTSTSDTVQGVTVANGTAIVSETPTQETVDQATEIKVAADQAVTDQTAVVASNQAEVDAAEAAQATAQADVTTAQEAVANATEENIAAAQADVTTAETAVTTAEADVATAQADVTSAETDVTNQETVVANDQAAIEAQETVVAASQTSVETAQQNLDGTGASTIIAERDDAASALETAKTAENTAQAELTAAKEQEANKANELAAAKAQETVQVKTAESTATSLATAKANLDSATAAKTAADEKVATLEAKIAEIEKISAAPIYPEYLKEAYRTYIKSNTQTNKDALLSAVQKWANEGDFGKDIIMPSTADDRVVDLANITDEQITELSLYAAYIAGSAREQIWGYNNLVVTEDTVAATRRVIEVYKTSTTSSHNYDALKQANSKTTAHISESLNWRGSSTATMKALYSAVFAGVISTWLSDYNHNYGHLMTFLGRTEKSVYDTQCRILGYTPHTAIMMATSVDANGVARVHALELLQRTDAPTIASPYDTTALKAELATAKTAQTAAVAAYNQANLIYTTAQKADTAAKANLSATREKIASLTASTTRLATAQANLTKATATRQAAETRLATAQTAVANLNASVATKQAALEAAKATLQAEETKLANLKAQKATDEASLADAKANLEAAQATLASKQADLDNSKQALSAAQTTLSNLQNADSLLATATANLETAKTAVAAAKAKLDASIDVLDELLANQKDATAQYDAVKQAWDKYVAVAERSYTDTGVTVGVTGIDATRDLELRVEDVTESDYGLSNLYDVYDIHFERDGVVYNIEGTATVRIPIQAGKTVAGVYYLLPTADGISKESLDYTIEDGYVVFDVTHFSFYGITYVDESAAPSSDIAAAYSYTFGGAYTYGEPNFTKAAVKSAVVNTLAERNHKANTLAETSHTANHAKLPETGEKDSLLGLLGYGLLASLGLAYAGDKRKRG